MDEVTATSDTRPVELVTGQTITLYRTHVVKTTAVDEKNVNQTIYTYTEYRFKPGEYEAMCYGTLPQGCEWSEDLHERFRNTQHRKTDDLYNEAYRCRRIATDDETGTAWDAYITALDEWNAQVTALASTFSTDVPELPQKPAA